MIILKIIYEKYFDETGKFIKSGSITLCAYVCK